ncbi:glycosyltransferase family A protein [Adhaeribacter rhizoryzae]|uniref:Glycosyltransferase family 2 protein n=1 Tax=Adhaeribacter rhizoryzae TaxID=2607907 RepID=A0A5M6DG61_9BACT|nr:glycosyltransferase family A protein [Adhaeribacter rhizoryzae]KAA5544215.1 glycosyltransferase family 2 protein [Adhaeribacter rhizoryzae]
MSNSFNPLVSVTTCFLNLEEYIGEMIESVLAQDYPNWELILLDDGSTDNSTVIAKDYAQRYPDKIFYHDHPGHQNLGLSASRNAAIKLANGEFITFLDGDDVFLPQYLSHQIYLQQNNPEAGLICEATEYWYTWTEQDKENVVVQVGAAPNQMYYPPQLSLQLYPLGNGASPCVCALLIRKSLLEKYGMFNAAFKGMYEDQVLMTKIFLNEPVYISATCNNRYRQRADSMLHSSHATGGYQRIRKRFLRWMLSYLQEENLNFPEVKQLVEENLAYSRPFYLLVKDYLWKVKKRMQGKKVLFH